MEFPLTPYRSGTLKISKSAQHKDMFIITHNDGKWHNFHGEVSAVLKKYPPNTKRVNKMVARLHAANLN